MAEAKIENTQGQDTAAKLVEYEKRIQAKDAELDTYKSMVKRLEEEVEKAQTQLTKWTRDAEQIDSLKNESEQTLARAKGMILERAKIIKNQELQLEAYGQQIESLKDVIRITKDLLEIRNLEVKQLEVKINCMEDKMKAEKERQDLMHKKLETMIRHNGELKREYEAQLALFTALRERYNERELARGVIDDMRADLRRERGETNADGAQNPPAAVVEEAKPAVEAVAEVAKPAVEAVVEVPKNTAEPVAEAAQKPAEPVAEAVQKPAEPVLNGAENAAKAVEEPKKESEPPKPE